MKPSILAAILASAFSLFGCASHSNTTHQLLPRARSLPPPRRRRQTLSTPNNRHRLIHAYQNLTRKHDGTLWAWGNSTFGQIGDNIGTNRIVPVQVGTLTTWSSVAGGQYHTTAVKTDGTLWTWGKNFNGQVGDTTAVTRSSPVQIGTLTTWSSVAAGGLHSTAIST